MMSRCLLMLALLAVSALGFYRPTTIIHRGAGLHTPTMAPSSERPPEPCLTSNSSLALQKQVVGFPKYLPLNPNSLCEYNRAIQGHLLKPSWTRPEKTAAELSAELRDPNLDASLTYRWPSAHTSTAAIPWTIAIGHYSTTGGGAWQLLSVVALGAYLGCVVVECRRNRARRRRVDQVVNIGFYWNLSCNLQAR